MQNVYHVKYGEGKLLENADMVIVEFNSEVVKFLNDAWGKYLFLSEEDMAIADKSLFKEKYSCYITQSEYQSSQISNSESETDVEDVSDELLCNANDKEIPLNELKAKFCIDNFDKSLKRVVFILHHEDVEIGKKKFVRLVGIDLATWKLVRIVDTNGLEKGFHSYNESAQKLKEGLIITATFELKESKDYYNLLRITSDFEICGKTTFRALRRKLGEKGIHVIQEPRDIISFSRRLTGCNFYCVTHFKDSQLRKNDIQYHLRLTNGVFVEVLDNKDKLPKLNGHWYVGLALLEITGRPEHIKAHRLYSKFFSSKKEAERVREKRHKKDSEYFEGVNRPEAMLEDFDMEVFLSEFDYDMLDNYEEMMPDVLEEYSDYYAEEYSDDFREHNYWASTDDDYDNADAY